jgi:hypothetical protein
MTNSISSLSKGNLINKYTKNVVLDGLDIYTNRLNDYFKEFKVENKNVF